MRYLFMNKKSILAGLTLFSASTVFGINATHNSINYTQSNGETIQVRLYGDEYNHYYTDLNGNVLVVDKNGDLITATEQQAKAARQRKTVAPRLLTAAYPKSGAPKSLIILVQFPDKQFSFGAEYFHNMLNQPGYSQLGATGSAKDYFIENSCGKFSPEFDVYGPITTQNNISYYGENDDALAFEMVIEACNQLDPQIDFSQYDTDGDGWVDNIYIFYAGYGQADGGSANTIWPHSSSLTLKGQTLRLDGKMIGQYGCSNELVGGTGRTLTGIGTFCHEFMHILGFPDLYSTATNSDESFTPNEWSIMDHGSYNNNGRTPPYLTAYERAFMGWMAPTRISGDAALRIPEVSENIAYRINTTSANEYYLLENRQKSGWDAYLPGHGMLVWHIDYNKSAWDANTVNNNPNHQYVDIVEADNTQTESSRSGDTFPGTAGITTLGDNTTPSLLSWANDPTGITLTNITESAGVIMSSVNGGGTLPAKPAVPYASEIGDNSFVINWSAVENATGYLIDIYTTENGRVRRLPNWTNKAVGTDATSIAVTGLAPETDYTFTVTAVSGISIGEKSDETNATTSAPGITYYAPTATAATNIGSQSFTANWESLTQADEYLLSVYHKATGNSIEDCQDFSNKLDLPNGWTTTCSSTFSVKNYYGEAAPSLRFQSNAEKLESPVYDDAATSLSFWYRGYSCDSSNSLVINGYINGAWTKIDERTGISNTTGTTYTCDADKLAGVKGIRIFYNNAAKGSVLVDDVKVGFGTAIVDEYDLKDFNVGSTTSYTVKDLKPNTDYYYYVIGKAGEKTSLQSNIISAKTSADAGIEGISDNAEIYAHGKTVVIATTGKYEIFNISGYKVAEGTGNAEINLNAAGLYIIKTNKNISKIILK